MKNNQSKLNTKTFIKKAKQVHGNKYNYRLVEYVNSRTKVKIICRKHGVFEQEPSSHLQNHGCKKCRDEYVSLRLRGSKDQFIKESKALYGDRFDYSEVEYVNNHTNVKLFCKKHQLHFETTPLRHLSKDGVHKSGCKRCAYESRSEPKFKDTIYFIEKSKEKYGDKYDYSLVTYERNNKKVEIVCPIHGPFYQTPANHLSGFGCTECGIMSRNEANKLTQEEFLHRVKSIHGDIYDFSESRYTGYEDPVVVKCKKHGKFLITPHNLLIGCGCQKCSNSKLEKCVESILKDNSIKFEIQKKFDWLRYKRLMRIDFFLPEYNVAIECQGDQHFTKTFFVTKAKSYGLDTIFDRDQKKYDLCKEHGIHILYFVNKYSDHIPDKYFGPIVKDKIELLFEIFKHKK